MTGQAAGYIYLMLEPDIQVMVAQHLLDPVAMWKRLTAFFIYIVTRDVSPILASVVPQNTKYVISL